MPRSGSWLLPLLVMFAVAGCRAPPGAATHITRADRHAAATVMTASGPVIGVTSAEGQAYLGIPYARAPVGALRWREPLPAVPWQTPRDAATLGHQCVQNLSPGAQTGKASHWLVIGDEDCLNLNIYTPSTAKPGDRKPVMVWIYGGALVLGANRQYDPSVLARRQDVVTVAVNYRLAALGFLAHPALRAEAGGAANLGLLDQQAALRWVRDNIARFGGDPGNVTLFGESAGAWSVCAQLVAPGARGLFQRVIVQSGPCTLNESTVPVADADAGGVRYAAALGCTGADAVACLRRLSPRGVNAALAPSRGVLGPHAWNFIAGDSVLPEAPREAFARGHFAHVPVLIGNNADEGRLFGFLLGKLGQLDDRRDYDARMASTFGAHADAVARAYPAARYPSLRDAYAAAVTDGVFACPTLSLSTMLARATPTWRYAFTDPQAPLALSRKADLGAYHASEIVYLFQTRWALADPIRFSPAQQALSDRMQKDWATFARTGRLDGTPEGAPANVLYGPSRTPVDEGVPRVGCAFWDTIGL